MSDPDVDEAVARLALERHGFSDQGSIRMINLSENATFLAHDPASAQETIVRVHRADYHSRAAIESELDWIAALRAEASVATPTVRPAPDGDRVITVDVAGQPRHAVLFEVAAGSEPDDAALDGSAFETLGALTARMHAHARSWCPPAGFARFTWDWADTLGDRPRWGRWQDGIGVGPDEQSILGEVATMIGSRLESYGRTTDRFGLVHADLRPANLLVHDHHITVIDFDDCGQSWFMYDFGTAVSFIEHDPRLPEWQEAWLRGYRAEMPLGEEHEEMLATFVMLRRLLLVAWMGSHSHAREVQDLGPDYTTGTVDLARRYQSSGGSTLS